MIKKPHTLISTKSILYPLNIYNVILLYIYLYKRVYFYNNYFFYKILFFVFINYLKPKISHHKYHTMKKTYKELNEEHKKLKKEYLKTFNEKTLQEIINVIEQMREIEKQVCRVYNNNLYK